MNKHYFVLLLALMLASCKSKGDVERELPTKIEFGDLKPMKASGLLSDLSFVKLETSDSSIIGGVNQLKIHDDYIYILDSYREVCVYRFSLDGKFVDKLEAKGNGPGEYNLPISFDIADGFIFVLDLATSRVLKYDLKDFNYIEEVIVPYIAPTSFIKIPKKDLFIYYYPVDEDLREDRKQIIIADSKGGVKHKLHEGAKPSEIGSGDSENVYMFDNQIRFYPHFSNTIYSIDSDSIVNVYHELLFGKYSFPNNDFFEKFKGNRQVQNTIEALYYGDKDWVKLLYAYETSNTLLTKYYIKFNAYVGSYNKISGDTFNFENSKFEDDLGIGGKFPLPICVYENLFVGKVDADDIDKSKVEDVKLRELVDNLSEEDNPILFFYSIK